MPQTPLISVIIPVFNRSKELKRAIESVLNQTYQNFEILVVDDGSTEDLRTVCKAFGDDRIRFFKNETHTNANVARNKGLKEAKGEYIAMLDSDDEFLPNHLQRRLDKIKEWGCDGIFGSAYVFDGKNKKLKLSRPLNNGELIINYLLSDGFAPTPSHFYKTHAAKEIMWDESLFRHQDFDFSVRFSKKYIFKSDYEPTVIINWIKGDKRNQDFSSYIIFIEKWGNTISKNIFVDYCISMHYFAKSEYNSQAKKYYKTKLKQSILYISMNQWLYLNEASGQIKKIIYTIYYLYLISISIAKSIPKHIKHRALTQT